MSHPHDTIRIHKRGAKMFDYDLTEVYADTEWYDLNRDEVETERLYALIHDYYDN